MSNDVRMHYERHPYPQFPLFVSVRPCDTYHLNLESLSAFFYGRLPEQRRILLAGCGSFSPYPTGIANRNAAITALDLSRRNLNRAHLHSILHGCFNIDYRQGDLLDTSTAPGLFNFIDCFGVLHHLADPLEGLRALERRLAPDGIIRIMVYSRYARRDEESIRRALRLLGIREISALKKLIRRAHPASRLGRYLAGSSEAKSGSGLADALLHPQALTFRIDQFRELISLAGLRPLRFAHWGALADVEEETQRLRGLEEVRGVTTNFIAYLGRSAPLSRENLPAGARLMLNPMLQECTGLLRLSKVQVAGRLGFPNPVLDRSNRAFLRRFRKPYPIAELTPSEQERAAPLLDAMFLVPLIS
ncbi:methyltransferase domain-containing protein [Geobacter sp. DSM 9736]|uniref:methyltransferase domain-containing protein n=1 Tax=Geobacter sp. DSM 9736 TaxID=1277350 RepID=UPI000B50A4CF|nr:methyltransferase domain-containing protein [Geobacter sp. DSM 9736]SNB47875.1 Methyltransferase domain-containing protein [Geobacter sp. DSM 9736]